MTERTTGYIKWFNPARRYGFIRREGGQPDVFVLQMTCATQGTPIA